MEAAGLVVVVGLLLVLLGIALGGKKEEPVGNSALIKRSHRSVMQHVDYPVLRQPVSRSSMKGAKKGKTW